MHECSNSRTVLTSSCWLLLVKREKFSQMKVTKIGNIALFTNWLIVRRRKSSQIKVMKIGDFALLTKWKWETFCMIICAFCMIICTQDLVVSQPHWVVIELRLKIKARFTNKIYSHKNQLQGVSSSMEGTSLTWVWVKVRYCIFLWV